MAFSLSLNSILSAANGGSPLAILSSIISPTYGIYFSSGDDKNKSALNFNSVIKFDISSQSAVTTVPIEAYDKNTNSYTSINKVSQPSRITMRVAIQGLTGLTGDLPNIPTVNFNFTSGLSINYDSPTDTINKLELMKLTAGLYNIQTPDYVYQNYDLINYQYVKTAQNGMSLLLVDLIFQELRVTGQGNQEYTSFFTKAKDAVNSTVETISSSVSSIIGSPQ